MGVIFLCSMAAHQFYLNLPLFIVNNFKLAV